MKKRIKHFLIAILLLCSSLGALAQDHFHPPQDVEIHEKFYLNWNRPDIRSPGGERQSSCCSKQDCYPTKIRNIGGSYFYERREDKNWLPIPSHLLESNQPDPRDSPDGRSHVCAQPPGLANTVYCATLGDGS